MQAEQASRPSYRDQEGRRGSDYVVLGTSLFLSNDNGMSGNFLSCIKCFKYRFEFPRDCWISLETLQWERASSRDDLGTRGFLRVMAGFSSYDGEFREPLHLAHGSPITIRITSGSRGLLSSHCRANRPHLGMCPQILCSCPVATGISGLHSRFTWGVRPCSSGSKELCSPLEL